MARKCSSPGCAFALPDKYPLDKCPWHIAPGRGPVKIAAALTIAAAGFGGGFAYKKFRRYLDEKKRRKEREESRKRQASAPGQEQKVPAVRKRAASKSRKRPGNRKRAATKSKPAE
jgi:transposase